jgi:hypothetical protein
VGVAEGDLTPSAPRSREASRGQALYGSIGPRDLTPKRSGAQGRAPRGVAKRRVGAVGFEATTPCSQSGDAASGTSGGTDASPVSKAIKRTSSTPCR